MGSYDTAAQIGIRGGALPSALHVNTRIDNSPQASAELEPVDSNLGLGIYATKDDLYYSLRWPGPSNNDREIIVAAIRNFSITHGRARYSATNGDTKETLKSSNIDGLLGEVPDAQEYTSLRVETENEIFGWEVGYLGHASCFALVSRDFMQPRLPALDSIISETYALTPNDRVWLGIFSHIYSQVDAERSAQPDMVPRLFLTQ